MAKVWKKLQRADGDFTGTIDGTAASSVKTGAVAGTAAKTITDAAFDSDTKLKTANAQAGMINSNTTASDVGLGSVENKSSATIRSELTVANITTNAGLGKGDIGLGSVENKSAATIMAGNLTGTIDNVAVATVKSGAAAGATANQDSTATILGGNLTGSVDGTAVATVKSGAAAGATANQDSTSTILGGNLTGTVNSVAVGTVTTGAAAGVSAKAITDDAFDSSGSDPILNVANAAAGLKNSGISISSGGVLSGAGGGTVTASGVGAIKTDASNAPNSLKNAQISISSAGVLSGAGGGTVSASGLGAVKTDLTNAPTTIVNSNTTKSDVGLGSVVNQAITVSGGKLAFNGSNQTIDADKVGGKTVAEAESSASSAAQTAIIGGAPGALNTLDELAAALGDDANFATTTTNTLATKGKAPMSLTAEDVDGDSTFDNDPANEVVGQIGVVGGEQYVVVDI